MTLEAKRPYIRGPYKWARVYLYKPCIRSIIGTKEYWDTLLGTYILFIAMPKMIANALFTLCHIIMRTTNKSTLFKASCLHICFKISLGRLDCRKLIDSSLICSNSNFHPAFENRNSVFTFTCTQAKPNVTKIEKLKEHLLNEQKMWVNMIKSIVILADKRYIYVKKQHCSQVKKTCLSLTDLALSCTEKIVRIWCPFNVYYKDIIPVW